MFMKHYAPNRCEPSNEVIMKMGVQWGCCFFVFFFFLLLFFFLGGGGVGGVRVDVNVKEGFKLL